MMAKLPLRSRARRAAPAALPFPLGQWLATVLVAAGSLLVTGCADTSAVTLASTQLVTASGAWEQVAAVPAASCRASSQLDVDVTACKEQERLTEGLGATDKVLLAYFTALQQAANTKNFAADKSLATLGASAAKIPDIGDKASAVTGLATFLVNLYEQHERYDVLRRLIEGGGPKARDVIDTLHDIVLPDLKGIVGNERTNLDIVFDDYLAAEHSGVNHATVDCGTGPKVSTFPTADPKKPMGTAYLLAIQYCQRAADTTKKEQLLSAYGDSLVAAKGILLSLERSKGRLSGRAAIDQLLSTGSDLATKVEQMKKVF